MLYDFGAPVGGLIQMAYIVEDIQAAAHQWIEQLKVGPWFILDSFTGGDPVYRGSPSQAEVAIGMAYSGSMMIELIQLKDEHPSVYREMRDRSGYGFHHFGLASENLDADLKAYESRGFELAFLAGVPTGGRVAYLDTDGQMPGFVELIETGPAMEAHFTGYRRAALGWDGSNPIRPFL